MIKKQLNNIKKISTFIIKGLVDLIYPPYCDLCQTFLSDGSVSICNNCWDALPRFPIDQEIFQEIQQKLNMQISLSGIFSIWKFQGNVQFIIHRLKYRHNVSFARKIAHFMIQKINEKIK